MQSIEFNQNGQLELEFPSSAESYYILKRGTTVDILDASVAAELGVDGTGRLSDSGLGDFGQTFYAIQKISLTEPLDSDGDGMDDVFELTYPQFLSPFNPDDADLDFDLDGSNNLKEYQDGTDPSKPPFQAASITEISPTSGEAMVNVTRNAVVRFDREMDPATIDSDSFYIKKNQEKILGSVEVSSTGMFATFFPSDPLPVSTQYQVVVDGSKVMDMDGISLDADGDGLPGGIRQSLFRTLSETRIPGTHVWGYVKDSFSGDPIEGVTLYVNAFPEASATTDSEGRFQLDDMPAPEFFVHIVGGTADNAPDGFTYPNLGKPFRSVPGQTVQISMEGEPFDIFLPPMAIEDTVGLSDSDITEVGFGAGGKQTLTALFPETDPAVWDTVCVEIAPNSARDDIGGTFDQAAIIPVPPDRIPEPLPGGLEMPVVISIQVPGATRFDVPAPVTFPNLPDPITGEILPPGAKSGLWSFDHDVGEWVLQGSMTVSEDGLFLVSDPGVGVQAPGWHGPNRGNQGSGGGGDDEGDDCKTEEQLLGSSILQCVVGVGAGFIELSPGVGCAVSLGVSAAGAALDCNIDPSSCGQTMAVAGTVGALGCIPGVGLGLAPVVCVATISNAYDNLKTCDLEVGKTPPEDDINDGEEEEEEENQVFVQQQSDFETQADTPTGTVIDNQIELMVRGQALYEATVGISAWQVVPVEDAVIVKMFMEELVAAMETESPAGVQINAEELAHLLTLVWPTTVSEEDVNALVARFNRFSAGGMTADEQNAIIDAANALKAHGEFLEALGWQTPYDGFTRGLADLTQRRASSITEVKKAPLYYKLTDMQTGFFRRGQLSFLGEFDNVILASNTYYSVEYFDPDTLGLGIAFFESPDSGNQVTIPPAHLGDSINPDSDGDGLADDIEAVVGTLANNPDSDGDGLSDLEELQGGSSPLDGVALPVGNLGNVTFSAPPQDIALTDTTAYAAIESDGLALVDISDPLLPILTGQLDLTGSSVEVAVDESAQVALVRTKGGFFDDETELAGIHFVDISDPFFPELLASYPIPATSILQHEGVFYVAEGTLGGSSYLRLFHADSLNQMAAWQVGSDAVADMLVYKGKLYAAVGNDLEVYDLNEPGIPRLADLPLAGQGSFQGGRQIHAENNVLFVGTTVGYATMDISDPANPQTLAEPDGTNLSINRFVSNGSGRLLAMVGLFGGNNVDIYQADDPMVVNQRLSFFNTGGQNTTDLDIRNGLLYITDDASGLVIRNYLEFDNEVSAPQVSLDLSGQDVDDQTPSIQMVEGSRLFVDAKITDDFQMRRSRWFLNDQLMETNQLGHHAFSGTLPTLAEGSGRVDVQVEAIDTGGNVGRSTVVTVELVPDTTDPQVLLSAPANGGADFRISNFPIWLNEPVDPDSIDPNQLSLSTESGTSIPIVGISFSNPQLLVIELDDPLPFDTYQFSLPSNGLTDLAGNPLSAALDLSFVSHDMEPGAALWISDTDGEYSDPANWNLGLLPRRNQSAYFERPISDPVIHFDDEGPVGSITVHEPFIITDHLFVQGSWESTRAGSFDRGRITFGGNALFSGPVTLDGATLAFSNVAEFSSDLILESGEFDLSGQTADLLIEGDLTPGDVGITCRNGASFEVTWMTTLGDTNPELTLNANDPGSRLVLPNLVTVSPPDEGSSSSDFLEISAHAGGVVEIPNLETINPGRIRLWVDGEGSILELPAVQKIEGPVAGNAAHINLKNSGTFIAGPISSLDRTNLEMDETVTFLVEAITEFTNGQLRIEGFNPDLSNLATVENIDLTVVQGGTIELGGLTTLNLDDNEWRAIGENSVIHLPDLETMTESQASSGAADFRTQSGGRIDLSNLTAMDGYFQFRSTGENSVIDLTGLTQLTTPENRESFLTATSGATLALTSPTIIRGDFDLNETGTISGTTITATEGSELNGPGTLSSGLINQGLIELNRDTGPIIIDGDLSLDSSSRVQVSIGLGSEFTGSGKLDVNGAAALGGTFEIVKRGSYDPQVGDAFEILTYGSKTGDFAQLEGLDLTEGVTGQLEITDTSVTLKVVASP